MRVLQVVPSLSPETGGPARSVPAQCAALQDAGADVTLLTHQRAGAPMTISAPRFRLETVAPRARTREFPTREWRAALERLVPRSDVVQLNSVWNPAITLAARACQRHRVPYVVSPRGMLQTRAVRHNGPLKAAYWLVAERATLAGASRMMLFNEGEAADSRLLPRGVPVTFIPNGIEPTLTTGVPRGKFRAERGLAGRPLVLFAGRIHWTKDLPLQARAIARLAQRLPDVAWVVAGPDDGDQAKLETQIQRLGIARNAVLTGALGRSDLLAAMADADAFLLTSLHEAHSVAMNEALALGVPQVLTESVRFTAVEDHGAGVVVPADAARIADALHAILTDASRAAKMREGAGRLVRERLEWPRVAEETLKVYRDIRRA